MDLAAIRAYPRAFFDIDAEELPDALIDPWARSGFTRVVSQINRWPFYEVSSTLNTEAQRDEYDVPAPIADVKYIEGPEGPLNWMEDGEGKRLYWQATVRPGAPEAFSVWAAHVRIYPRPDDAYALSITGYRAPIDWVRFGAGAVPDCPPQFHEAILEWVMHKAYMHQDDIEMSQVHKKSFDEMVALMTAAELETPPSQPLVLGGPRRRKVLPNRILFPWER